MTSVLKQDRFYNNSKLDTDFSVKSFMYSSKFVSSFIGKSRKGDLFSESLPHRSAAWANWFTSSLTVFQGLADREYVGLALPAKFYDNLYAPEVTPHVEIPGRVLHASAEFFPVNLALLGNAILSPSWIFSEVKATRKALFMDVTDISSFATFLYSYRSGLVDRLVDLQVSLKNSYSLFESTVMSNPAIVSDIILKGFDTKAVKKILRDFPYTVSIYPEPDFASKQNKWISRRLVPWRVDFSATSTEKLTMRARENIKFFEGSSDNVSGSFGVVTPRLTFNSLFNDPLFSPSRDSLASILVRILLLEELTKFFPSNIENKFPVPATDNLNTFSFRPIPARPDAKAPQASTKAAVAFVTAFNNPDSAFAALSSWAGGKYVLTVSRKDFISSFISARKAISRLEDPSRYDINNILPLCWYSSKVFRVSFIYS